MSVNALVNGLTCLNVSFSKTSWTNVTPAGIPITPHGPFPSYGCIWVECPKTAPNIYYVCVDDYGLMKSVDYGKTYVKMGNTPTPAGPTGGTTNTLDSPFCLRADPLDATHLVCTEGVRGSTLGWWESHDSGANWTFPASLAAALAPVGNTIGDLTSFAVDPTDFNHQLIGSHTPWTGFTGGGILETTDCGATWRAILPQPSWANGTMGLAFLFDPATGQGDKNTWGIFTDGAGFWKTRDAGATMTQVSSTLGIPHGGTQTTYLPSGRVMTGCPAYSDDNGDTWTALTGLPIDSLMYCFGLDQHGRVYCSPSYTGEGPLPFNVGMYTSDTNATAPWATSAQTWSDGPYNFTYNPTSKLLTWSGWGAGVWTIQT